MSTFMRVQVTIPMDSGVPEDSVVNVWHFDSDQTFAEDADDVVGRLAAFYQAIDSVVFDSRVGPGADVKVYDLGDAEPRAPKYTTNFGLTTGSTGVYIPNEVAICLSMAAEPQSGVNPGRLRGRIFLGPIRSDCLELVSSKVRIKETVRTAIVDAAVDLATGPDAGDGRLAIFSPTTWAEFDNAPLLLDAAFNDVVKVWVDNAPDTIRSRGEKADARTSADIS